MLNLAVAFLTGSLLTLWLSWSPAVSADPCSRGFQSDLSDVRLEPVPQFNQAGPIWHTTPEPMPYGSIPDRTWP